MPHYDEEAVNAIVKKLQDPELGSAGKVIKDRESNQNLPQCHRTRRICSTLTKIQTYVVDRPRRIANSSRLMKLAGYLNFHGVGQGLQGNAKRFVIDRLLEQPNRLTDDPQWAARVEGSAKIPVKEFTIECGEWKLGVEHETYSIPATDENIYAFLNGAAVYSGKDCMVYANRTEFRGDINTARLELFQILQDEKAPKLIQRPANGNSKSCGQSTRTKSRKCWPRSARNFGNFVGAAASHLPSR